MTNEKAEVLITPASFPDDRDAVAELFNAYATSLPVDISWQGFNEELKTLPGKYSSSARGAVFLARVSPTSPAIGVIALRALGPQTCEVKRLYISPSARGLGAGKLLIDRLVEAAEELGYKEAFLDTLRTMTPARALYAKCGFQETEKYYENPLPGVIYMKRFLKDDRGGD
ncbi:acyl-CoA N-acyltransferase [Corynespora cassiicola Philippines]|uniref:Acyl-CoA N-acyltransferase n=1 Tax=Corynespora cassiicola Philippines TaxID=1448308 RepID=A0A2T2PAK7_CORCC|nr:acyl-CoA N-acyltransferase [Corynespora cassiicola Philippines]